MWIQCRCGNQIKDITDDIAYKAHYISDQDWFEVLDEIDNAIMNTCADKKEVCNKVFSFISKRSKNIYQCTACGRLFIDDNDRNLNEFTPVKNMGNKTVTKNLNKSVQICTE